MRGRQKEERPLSLRRDLRSWKARSMSSLSGSRHYGVPELASFPQIPSGVTEPNPENLASRLKKVYQLLNKILSLFSSLEKSSGFPNYDAYPPDNSHKNS